MNRKQAQAANALFLATMGEAIELHLPKMIQEKLKNESMLIEHVWSLGEAIEVRFWGYERSTIFFMGSAIEPSEGGYKVMVQTGVQKIWRTNGLGESIDKLVEFKMIERNGGPQAR